MVHGYTNYASAVYRHVYARTQNGYNSYILHTTRRHIYHAYNDATLSRTVRRTLRSVLYHQQEEFVDTLLFFSIVLLIFINLLDYKIIFDITISLRSF